MPICIECRYPVPQLYASSSSSSSSNSTSTSSAGAPPSKNTSNNNTTTSSSTSSTAANTTATSSSSSSSAAANRDHHPTGPAPGGEAKQQRSTKGAGDVRLTQCPRCKRFADKYVEHDFVVLFIDLVLVKPQVYRHLLFNRLGGREKGEGLDRSVLRLAAFILLFDVYILWSGIEALPAERLAKSPLPGLPLLAQYVFYLALCAAMSLVQHIVVRGLASTLPWWRPTSRINSSGSNNGNNNGGNNGGSWNGGATGQHGVGGNSVEASASGAATTPGQGQIHSRAGSGGHSTPSSQQQLSPTPTSPTAISTALFVSSCMKLFPILIVVWRYEDSGGTLARYVEWAVALQNMEALRILMGCELWVAALLAGAGAVVRAVVSWVVLGAVGLGE